MRRTSVLSCATIWEVPITTLKPSTRLSAAMPEFVLGTSADEEKPPADSPSAGQDGFKLLLRSRNKPDNLESFPGRVPLEAG
mmetsp:Transcript_54189/g.87560  ORF Transcript_54189/g.87560 Transcript_54189/m.87560 type:complete len:82 (+) Transcript_54189:949-1194(+)